MAFASHCSAIYGMSYIHSLYHAPPDAGALYGCSVITTPPEATRGKAHITFFGEVIGGAGIDGCNKAIGAAAGGSKFGTGPLIIGTIWTWPTFFGDTSGGGGGVALRMEACCSVGSRRGDSVGGIKAGSHHGDACCSIGGKRGDSAGGNMAGANRGEAVGGGVNVFLRAWKVGESMGDSLGGGVWCAKL